MTLAPLSSSIPESSQPLTRLRSSEPVRPPAVLQDQWEKGRRGGRNCGGLRGFLASPYPQSANIVGIPRSCSRDVVAWSPTIAGLEMSTPVEWSRSSNWR